MARRLLVVRHAKAVRDGSTDEARPLAPRGVRDARAAGRWLVEHELVPDRVVVSPAVRAIQTWEAAASKLGSAPPVSVDARLYDNTVESLLAVVHDVDDAVRSVAIVGHNPSMHGLAVALDDGRGDDRARAQISEGYPTSGIAVLELDLAWARLAPGGATVREFVTPRG